MLAMLVVNGSMNLDRARSLLDGVGNSEIRTFGQAASALDAASGTRFDLIVVDHDLARTGVVGLIKAFREMPNYAHVPILVLTSKSEKSLHMQVLSAGATSIFSNTWTCAESTLKLRNLIKLLRATREREDHVAEMARDLEASTRKLNDREEEMMFRLSLAVEYRDNDTGDHTWRVARHAKMIAEELGLSPQESRNIYLAAPLHDIGKVAIPDHILLKPGRLTEDETALMRTHSEVGERILKHSTCELLRLASEIAGYHHERWDGRGYPREVSGADIPFSARIVAVADVFDAMTTERPYKAAKPVQEALDYLESQRGRQFDPDCVDAFLTAYRRQHAMFGQRTNGSGDGTSPAQIVPQGVV